MQSSKRLFFLCRILKTLTLCRCDEPRCSWIYAEADKATDEEIDAIHQVKSSRRGAKKIAESEGEHDDDPFFHALLHNNDVHVVKETKDVSNDENRVDTAMFERLNAKLFPHRHDDSGEPKEVKEVHYDAHDFLMDCEGFE